MIMDRSRKAVIYAVIYTMIMAIGMFSSYHIFGYSYDSPKIDRILIWFELVMSIFAILIYIRSRNGKAFGRLKITPTFLIYSLLMISGALSYIIKGCYRDSSPNYSHIFITTLFVAFSEEMMYRGIVLGAFLEKHSRLKAIMLSSMMFSLLHTVNMLGGVSFSSMMIQLANTFIFGLVLSSFMVRNGNIIPLMIYHFIWDMVLISPSFMENASWMIASTVTLSIILAIALPIAIGKEDRKKGLMQIQGM